MTSIEVICSSCAGTINATDDCLSGRCPHCGAVWDVHDYWETDSEAALDMEEGIEVE